MESLYRKYRPQTFADVVGQQHVVGTLEHAVREGRTSHAYLFCGPRGTGKTTMARLLAKALMCEQGPGHLPDGTCEQCALIATGEHPDVYELDAASRTGVDNVREEIINRVDYAPVQGRYKVYIIDEVHMLTTAAFNALLKTLEEPPSHVVFVLCTTDPQKIPATILSRVQRFDFRPIGAEDILFRLVYVCEQEGFTYEDSALELVVQHARGGMRDALSTLEQLSVFGSGTIGLEAARDLLGAVSGDELEQVIRAMAARDVAMLFSQTGALVDSGRDLLQFTRELAAHLRDVYVVAAVGGNPAVLPPASDVMRLQAEAEAFGSPDRLARILALLGDVSREMATAPNQRLVLEIAFTRIARPEVDLTLDSLAERIAVLEQRIATLGTSGAQANNRTDFPSDEAADEKTPQPQTATQRPVQPAQPQPAMRQRPAPQRAPQPAAQHHRAKPAQQPAPRSKTAASEPNEAKSVERPRKLAGLEAGALQRAWRQVVSELTSRLPSRGSLLSSAMATSDNGEELVIGLPKGSMFALKMLERPDVRSAVEGVVFEVFGSRTLVFKEGLGSDLKVPTYAAAPAPPATPSMSPSSVPASPTSAPASRVQRPSSQPRPTPTYAPRSEAKPSYPMPWDTPSPAPAPTSVPTPAPEPSSSSSSAYDEVPYDAVPYDDMPYEDVPYEDVPYEAYSSPTAEPVSAPSSASVPTSAKSPAPAPASIRPERTSSPAPASSSVSATSPRDVPADLPDDLVAILENAFDVFGEDLRIIEKS